MDTVDSVMAQLFNDAERSAEPRPGALRVEPVIERLADVAPLPVDWLWPGRIALGKLTLLAGDPGLGKSLIALDIAARVSRGAAWPDEKASQRAHSPQLAGGTWEGFEPSASRGLCDERDTYGSSTGRGLCDERDEPGSPASRGLCGEHKPGGVVLMSAEDDLADTIRPRLDAAGADVAQIRAVSMVTAPGRYRRERRQL